MKLLKFLNHKAAISLDSSFSIFFRLFTKSKFDNLILRLKLYKLINKKLYNILWKKIVDCLHFCHQQIDLTIEQDQIRKNYKAIDLSRYAICVGYKISFIELKKTFDQRHLLIVFQKNGVEKFKDDITYYVNGKMISSGKDNKVRSSTIKEIISLIEEIEKDSPNYRQVEKKHHKDKIETEA